MASFLNLNQDNLLSYSLASLPDLLKVLNCLIVTIMSHKDAGYAHS